MAKKKLTKDQLEKLKTFCRLKPSLKDCSYFFEVSERTIERFIKEQTGLTFADFRESAMVYTRHNLIREALRRAHGGSDRMLQFCLTNLCDWSTNQRVEANVTTNANVELVKALEKYAVDK